jgi:hypothetical protein
MAKKKGNTSKKKEDYNKINVMLVENFVEIQKVLVNTAGKIEDLSLQISKLLQLFELSAKSFAGKVDEKVSEIEKDREFLTKLNALLEQNKLIAKGLTLMEENIRERVSSNVPQIQPQPRFPNQYNPPMNPSYKASSFDTSMNPNKNKFQKEI